MIEINKIIERYKGDRPLRVGITSDKGETYFHFSCNEPGDGLNCILTFDSINRLIELNDSYTLIERLKSDAEGGNITWKEYEKKSDMILYDDLLIKYINNIFSAAGIKWVYPEIKMLEDYPVNN